MKHTKLLGNKLTLLGAFLKISLLVICIAPFLFGLMINYSEASENSRGPASLIHSDHVQMSPIEEEIWLNTVFVEDKKGVLKEMTHNFKMWQEKERYAEQWNLESTGLYQTPTEAQKKNYLSKKALKYLDKRISGEVKRAEKGSSLHKIGQVQKTLKPSTTVNMSPNFRMSFKSRILDGEAMMVLVNPYFDNTTTIDLQGDVNLDLSKEFEKLKLSTRFHMNLNRGEWELHCNRPISKKWSGQFIARETNTYNQEQIMRISYSHRF